LTTIAILGGTGNEGSGLALRWAKAGHNLLIGSRSVERAGQTAAEINAQVGREAACGNDNESAARAGDIVVLTVPAEAQIPTLESVKSVLAGKILVDATARVLAKDPRPPTGRAAARSAQDFLGPDVRVVAAFQNVPAYALKRLEIELASDVLVCGDEIEAKQQVIALAEAAGMNAYDAGPLDNAVVVEGLTALIMSLNRRYKSKTGGIRVSGVNR
jgi:8-hydroxy-5-deazaflavin:NADPH oxidoreductase